MDMGEKGNLDSSLPPSLKTEATFLPLTLKFTVNAVCSALAALFGYFVDGLNSNLVYTMFILTYKALGLIFRVADVCFDYKTLGLIFRIAVQRYFSLELLV